MARESNRLVVCRSCGYVLEDEGPQLGLLRNTIPPERPACPRCGSTAREYRLELGATVRPGGDVTIKPPPAAASASAPEPIPSVDRDVEAGTLERTVIWSKNPDAWLAEVRDTDGSLLGVQISFDADDVYLDLRDLLGPP